MLPTRPQALLTTRLPLRARGMGLTCYVPRYVPALDLLVLMNFRWCGKLGYRRWPAGILNGLPTFVAPFHQAPLQRGAAA